MKAPDKINVPILNGKLFGIIKEDGGRFRDCDGHIEYLRKDALLEWAKDRLDFAKALGSQGQQIVCGELIQKLNSM